jgi:hypothetical protein
MVTGLLSLNVPCDDRRVTSHEAPELVLVYTTASVMDGYLAKGRLEVEGIPVLLQGGEGPYRVGPVSLFVSKEDEHDARALLATVTVEDDPNEQDEMGSLNGEPRG